MLEALGNSLFLGVVSCLVSAVIGTLGAVGLSRDPLEDKRDSGIYFYFTADDP